MLQRSQSFLTGKNVVGERKKESAKMLNYSALEIKRLDL